MPRIITITSNTAIDKISPLNSSDRDINSPSALFAAGKGINVARTVAALNRQVLALGFVGQSEQQFFASLKSTSFEVRLIPVSGRTRVNLSTVDSTGRIVSHVRQPGFSITPQDSEDLTALIKESVSRNDVVVISGSMPLGGKPSMYGRLVDLCKDCGATVILDSSNQEFIAGIQASPYMIKPNMEEFKFLIGRNFRDDEHGLLQSGREILKRAIKLVVVSRGADGIIVVSTDNACWKANVTLDKQFATSESVGSGDALVGGFAVGLLEQRSLVDTIRLGVACGAANLLTAGPGNCKIEDVNFLVPRVRIERLDVR